MLQRVYDAIDDSDADEAVWLDHKTMSPHARVYLLARQYGLPALQQAACDRLVDVFRHSPNLPATPPGPQDLLTAIRDIFAGPTAEDDNAIRIWLVRYCTYHIRERLGSYDYRDRLGEIMAEYGGLSSTILLLKYSDSIEVVTLHTCVGCRFRWVETRDLKKVDPRDWCRNCDYVPRVFEDYPDDGPYSMRRRFVEDPVTNWLDNYRHVDE